MATALVYEDDATGWRPMTASDLPNSGVTASTYGDSTHVGQFTVNAQGILTAASSVAITAAGGITDLTSSGSTITVTNPTGPTTNVDLPTSGVSAGTYGSASNIPQVTVNAEGIVTAASNVGLPTFSLGTYQSFTGTASPTGFSGALTTNVAEWVQNGQFVHVYFVFIGTSNATTMSFTLPVATNSADAGLIQPLWIENNGAAGNGRLLVTANSTTANLNTAITGGGFTASGTKGAQGSFVYRSN